ncbi:MAG: beta-galactosidase [Verrucomicrobiota bacterium]
MYFGVDYHPEQWVYPYAGTVENPEAQWEVDAELMVAAGFNVVRIGEFSWGICEREDGKFDFAWLRRVMDVMGKHGIQVVTGTPTAAPPLWLGLSKFSRSTNAASSNRHTPGVCLNSDAYWNHAKRIVQEIGQSPRRPSPAYRVADPAT